MVSGTTPPTIQKVDSHKSDSTPTASSNSEQERDNNDNDDFSSDPEEEEEEDDERSSSEEDDESDEFSDDHSDRSSYASSDSVTEKQQQVDSSEQQHQDQNHIRTTTSQPRSSVTAMTTLENNFYSFNSEKSQLHSRRRKTRSSNDHDHPSQPRAAAASDDDDAAHKKRKRKPGRSWRKSDGWNRIDRLAMVLDRNFPLVPLYRFCQVLFYLCFLFWCLVLLHHVWPSTSHKRSRPWDSTVPDHTLNAVLEGSPKEQLPPELVREKRSVYGFFKDVSEGLLDMAAPNKGGSVLDSALRRRKNREVDAPGCVREEWQSYHFPTCNDVHEIDTRDIFDHSHPNTAFGGQRPHRHSVNDTFPPLQHNFVNLMALHQHWTTPENGASGTHEATHFWDPAPRLGYLGSGYWKNVWAVNPRIVDEVVVFKAMKRQHDLDRRNLDRHRRDALVMERLTSSPHVVDIHGHCGSSVLSEYIPTTLSSIVETDMFHRKKQPSKLKQPGLPQLTRDTPQGRLALSLQVAYGLYELHNGMGSSPIVHADVTAEQFLVTSDGTIKINDFNRCRFMAHKESNASELCEFIIPSAPGRARSPEEYSVEKLTHQIDVYSLANVLFLILTGEDPWQGLTMGETKLTVRKGGMPEIPAEFRQANSTDASLTQLIERAYEFNPKTRITSKALLQELQTLANEV